MLGRVASLRRGIAGRLFTQDSVPLWDTRQRASAFLELPDRIRSAIAADVAQLRQFVGRQGWKAAVQVAIFLGLVLLMSAVRRGASQWAGSAELETQRARVRSTHLGGSRAHGPALRLDLPDRTGARDRDPGQDRGVAPRPPDHAALARSGARAHAERDRRVLPGRNHPQLCFGGPVAGAA